MLEEPLAVLERLEWSKARARGATQIVIASAARFTETRRLSESRSATRRLGFASPPDPRGAGLGPPLLPNGRHVEASHIRKPCWERSGCSAFHGCCPNGSPRRGVEALRHAGPDRRKPVRVDLQIAANRRCVTELESMVRAAPSIRTTGSRGDITQLHGRLGTPRSALITRRSGVRIPSPLPDISKEPSHCEGFFVSQVLGGRLSRAQKGPQRPWVEPAAPIARARRPLPLRA